MHIFEVRSKNMEDTLVAPIILVIVFECLEVFPQICPHNSRKLVVLTDAKPIIYGPRQSSRRSRSRRRRSASPRRSELR